MAWAVVDGKKVSTLSPAENSERQALSAVVKLSLGRDGSGTCTATVISRFPPLLATARHCVEDENDKPKVLQALTFVDGLLEAMPQQLPAKVKRVHVNAAEKEKRGRGDYALIELEDGALPARAGVVPVPKECPILRPAGGNTKLWVAGYGANAFGLVPDGKGAASPKPGTVVGVGTLRWGTNDVVGAGNGLVRYNGNLPGANPPDSGNGVAVGVGPGDSGGPVFAQVPGQNKQALAAITGSLEKYTLSRTPNGVENAAADTCDPLTNKFLTSVATRGTAPQIGTSMVPQGEADSEAESH